VRVPAIVDSVAPSPLLSRHQRGKPRLRRPHQTPGVQPAEYQPRGGNLATADVDLLRCLQIA
jgi:hypothetical protein